MYTPRPPHESATVAEDLVHAPLSDIARRAIARASAHRADGQFPAAVSDAVETLALLEELLRSIRDLRQAAERAPPGLDVDALDRLETSARTSWRELRAMLMTVSA